MQVVIKSSGQGGMEYLQYTLIWRKMHFVFMCNQGYFKMEFQTFYQLIDWSKCATPNVAECEKQVHFKLPNFHAAQRRPGLKNAILHSEVYIGVRSGIFCYRL